MSNTNIDPLDEVLDILIDEAVEARMKWKHDNESAKNQGKDGAGFTNYQKRLREAHSITKQAINNYINSRIVEELETLMQGHSQPYAAGNAEIILNAIHDRINELNQVKGEQE